MLSVWLVGHKHEPEDKFLKSVLQLKQPVAKVELQVKHEKWHILHIETPITLT